MALQVFTNIRHLVNVRSEFSQLRGKHLAELPVIEQAFLVIEDDEIVNFGEMKNFERLNPGAQYVTDAGGKSVLPCWCDSHTHLVFAGSRENEFIDKIRGLTYTDIAAKGGGILSSVKWLNETSESELFNEAWIRLKEVSRLGTGAIEIKSGYGLSLGGELKMLRVIKRLKEKSPLLIKSTFLGAHTYPQRYQNDHEAYVNNIINDMLPVVAAEKLADYIDVFCDSGFFSPAETEVICRAGLQYGLKPKLHVNQFEATGGIEVGLQLNAVSLDHLEVMPDHEIIKLASSNMIGTLLPGAAFFLNMPLPPARELINAGAALALASDYNPGSAPSGNMNVVISLACIQMKMLPEEAINAATINGAYAMELQNEAGSITIGKKANLIFTRPIPSLAYLPYSFGSNLIDSVMINGEFIS